MIFTMPYKPNLRQPYPNELYHFGILGQKWGVRRFQNADGSYTAAGKKRYNSGEGKKRKNHKINKKKPAKSVSDEVGTALKEKGFDFTWDRNGIVGYRKHVKNTDFDINMESCKDDPYGFKNKRNIERTKLASSLVNKTPKIVDTVHKDILQNHRGIATRHWHDTYGHGYGVNRKPTDEELINFLNARSRILIPHYGDVRAIYSIFDGDIDVTLNPDGSIKEYDWGRKY